MPVRERERHNPKASAETFATESALNCKPKGHQHCRTQIPEAGDGSTERARSLAPCAEHMEAPNPAHPNLMQFKPSQAPSMQQWREPYMFANSRDGDCRGEAKRPKQRTCQAYREGCLAGFALKKPTVGLCFLCKMFTIGLQM